MTPDKGRDLTPSERRFVCALAGVDEAEVVSARLIEPGDVILVKEGRVSEVPITIDFVLDEKDGAR